MFSPATSPSGYSLPLNSPLSGENSLLILKRLSWARRPQLLHYRERTTFRKEECFKNLCLGTSPKTSFPLLTSARHLPPLLREGEVPNGRGGRQYYTLYYARVHMRVGVCEEGCKIARLQDSTSPVRKIFFPNWEKKIGQLGKKTKGFYLLQLAFPVHNFVTIDSIISTILAKILSLAT